MNTTLENLLVRESIIIVFRCSRAAKSNLDLNLQINLHYFMDSCDGIAFQ